MAGAPINKTNKTMKKLILMLLVLVGGVMQANADNKTFYLETTSTIWGVGDARYVAYWGTSEGHGWAFFNKAPNEATIYSVEIPADATGMIIYRRNPSDSDDASKSDQGYWNTTGDITLNDFNLITITDWNNSYTTGTYTHATINSVTLSYGLSGEDWSNLTLQGSNGTYTGTLDLSSTFEDQGFKLIINGTWLGTNSFTITDPGNLVTPGASAGDNLTLANKAYKTYTVTATWVSNSQATNNWTLTITGVSERASASYTVTLNNAANWGNAYAYTFGPQQNGNWPGTAMTNNGDGTYSFTFTAYEPLTSKIIFNNNDDSQTANLNLINNHTYTNNAEAKYYVVGSTDEFGNWDHSKNAALMTFVENGNQDYYTYSADDLELSGDVSFKIVKKSYVEQAEPDGWYPDDNRTISITENGKYDVTVRFNSYYEDWRNDGVASGEATLVAIPATIGSTGYATFSSLSHDLDFSSVTELTAYRAESATNGVVKMTKITDAVPASTGLFLAGESAYIPVTTGATSVGDNLLVAGTDAGVAASTTNSYNYVFAKKKSGDLGFYLVDTAVTSDMTGKAYLHSTSSLVLNAPSLSFEFDNGTTGINVINAEDINSDSNNQIYDLSGRRVTNPTRGIFIKNGKKYVIK